MGLREELLAETGPKTHVAELCGRAADELIIKEMVIEQRDREIERLRGALGRSSHFLSRAADACSDGDLSDPRIDELSDWAVEVEEMLAKAKV